MRLTARAAADPPVCLPHSAAWAMRAGGDPAREYRIMLSLPEGDAPPGGFPVVLVLDGDLAFATAAAAVRLQSSGRGAAPLQPAAILGIGYPGDDAARTRRRTLDYTPPVMGAPDGTGGADRFLNFIATELIAAVAARLPIDAARLSIFGHSFGGLCVLHAVFTRPGLFSCAVAASPSIWWQDDAVRAAERRFTAADAAMTRLLITVGTLEEAAAEDPALPPERRARLRQARMVSNAREMAARLQALAPGGLLTRVVELPDEDHGSVLPAAISRGLRFMLARP